MEQRQASTETPTGYAATAPGTVRAKRASYAIDGPAYGTPQDFDELGRLASNLGSHWFDRDTIRYFKCHLHGPIFATDRGWIFVSSERGPHAARRYTVRIARYDRAGADGVREGFTVETIGLFQQYGTLTAARGAARRAALEVV